MAWEGSTRRQRLPSNWGAIVVAVKRRAKRTSPFGYAQCEWVDNGNRCTELGTQCDHIHPMTDDHRPDACQWLCTPHHTRKTTTEAAQARATRRALRYRTPDPHPGLRP